LEKLYSAEEVAKMVGRTGFTIREHLKKGILKGHKSVTNRWVIRHKDVLAYMGIEEDDCDDISDN
jgi:predicted site-specific integrase-resolvase